jgi:hypothetical protein
LGIFKGIFIEKLDIARTASHEASSFLSGADNMDENAVYGGAGTFAHIWIFIKKLDKNLKSRMQKNTICI